MAKSARAEPPRFDGFADRNGKFFGVLARNQRREWFAMHKEEYEEGWLTPMKALLAEVRTRLEPLYDHDPLAEPKVFRIHRDVRFSKDKSPYKTHIGGYVPLAGAARGPNQPVPVYVQLGTETFVGAGHYMMEPAQLARFREAVLDDAQGKTLARIVATLEKAKFRLVSYDALKKVPRGIDPAHPRAELLKRKSLAVEFPTLPKRLVTSRKFVDWLVDRVDQSRPLVEWLAELSG